MEQIVRNITCEIRYFLRMGKLIMPAQQNKPWTEEDDRRLIKMRAAGRSMASISAALKRSAGAVAGRIGALALGPEQRRMRVQPCPKMMLASSQREGLASVAAVHIMITAFVSIGELTARAIF
jgi:hypothetical protein